MTKIHLQFQTIAETGESVLIVTNDSPGTATLVLDSKTASIWRPHMDLDCIPLAQGASVWICKKDGVPGRPSTSKSLEEVTAERDILKTLAKSAAEEILRLTRQLDGIKALLDRLDEKESC